MITPYGVMLALALVLSGLWARRRALRKGIDPSHIDFMLPAALLVSLAGVFLLRQASDTVTVPLGPGIEVPFRHQFFEYLFFAVPFIALYTYLFRLPLRRMGDVLALPMLLGHILLGTGCFLAGCCWGKIINVNEATAGLDPHIISQLQAASWLDPLSGLFAVQFPAQSFAWQQHYMAGLIGPHATHSLPVHPTQLYAVALTGLLLAVLIRADRAKPAAGMLAVAALGGYAVLRFAVEFLRADNPPVLGGLTSPQLFALAVICASIAGYALLRKRNRILHHNVSRVPSSRELS